MRPSSAASTGSTAGEHVPEQEERGCPSRSRRASSAFAGVTFREPRDGQADEDRAAGDRAEEEDLRSVLISL